MTEFGSSIETKFNRMIDQTSKKEYFLIPSRFWLHKYDSHRIIMKLPALTRLATTLHEDIE